MLQKYDTGGVRKRVTGGMRPSPTARATTCLGDPAWTEEVESAVIYVFPTIKSEEIKEASTISAGVPKSTPARGERLQNIEHSSTSSSKRLGHHSVDYL